MHKKRLGFVACIIVAFSFFTNAHADTVRDIGNLEVNVKQLKDAVASRTLTWLTGNSASNDYISVGRTANYFGFVGLRVASGQSVSRSDVANDTLSVLNDTQRQELVALLDQQREPFLRTQAARFKINRALEGFLIGESISLDNFLELGRVYGSSEAELGRVIGQKLGKVAQTLTPQQLQALEDIRAAHVSGQGQSIQRRGLRLKLSTADKKELVNIAARFLSWTTGSEEFNDFEVVGKPSQHFGFVSLRVGSNHGVRRGRVAKEVWEILTEKQREVVSATALNNAALFDDFLSARSTLMRILENALVGHSINEDKVRVAGGAVGEIEARMTWSQATAMITLRNSFTDKQSSDLLALRVKYAPAEVDLPNNPLERGRQLYAQCALCHNRDGQTSIAPSLFGVIGRAIASDDGFGGYSSALSTFGEKAGVWDRSLLNRFLASPKSLVPGTFMRFDGFENTLDREAILVFLEDMDKH